jgi:hypothetical protein
LSSQDFPFKRPKVNTVTRKDMEKSYIQGCTRVESMKEGGRGRWVHAAIGNLSPDKVFV